MTDFGALWTLGKGKLGFFSRSVSLKHRFMFIYLNKSENIKHKTKNISLLMESL